MAAIEVAGASAPGQQLGQPFLRRRGDAGKRVDQPGLWVDVVELRGRDQCRHGGCVIGPPVEVGEEPSLPAEGEAAQRALGGVVAEADAAAVDEAGEAILALEHVVDGLSDRG